MNNSCEVWTNTLSFCQIHFEYVKVVKQFFNFYTSRCLKINQFFYLNILRQLFSIFPNPESNLKLNCKNHKRRLTLFVWIHSSKIQISPPTWKLLKNMHENSKNCAHFLIYFWNTKFTFTGTNGLDPTQPLSIYKLWHQAFAAATFNAALIMMRFSLGATQRR